MERVRDVICFVFFVLCFLARSWSRGARDGKEGTTRVCGTEIWIPGFQSNLALSCAFSLLYFFLFSFWARNQSKGLKMAVSPDVQTSSALARPRRDVSGRKIAGSCMGWFFSLEFFVRQDGKEVLNSGLRRQQIC